MSWSEEQIEMLKALWGQGMTANDIAKLLGDTSRNAVIGKAHRLGLSGRPSPIKKKVIHGHTFFTLTDRMCKWPFGDPKKPDFHFCGRPVEVTITYCAEHRAIAYQAPKKPMITTK